MITDIKILKFKSIFWLVQGETTKKQLALMTNQNRTITIKVMISIAIFVKNLTSGGAEKQSVLLAKALANDYDVHYIILNDAKIHEKYLDMLHEDNKIKTISFKGSLIKRYIHFVKYLKANNIKAIFSYLTAANVFACLAKILTRTKVYTGIRNSELPLVKCIADKVLTNYFSDQTICNCFSGKENFVNKGFKSSKISVIPNCFENISTNESINNNSNIHIITVGRFVPQKDYETAIKCIAEVRKNNSNIIFDIVGYGELENNIRTWLKQYQIEDITNVFINPHNIPELLQHADIYLSTSLFEGTSNSIMEGMNANLPIVATNVGDNAQLIKQGYNGFISNIKDYKNLAKNLNLLISDNKLKTDMGMHSKELLKSEYSMEQFRKKYLSILGKNL